MQSAPNLKSDSSRRDKVIDYLLVAILANGHVLLEGVPRRCKDDGG